MMSVRSKFHAMQRLPKNIVLAVLIGTLLGWLYVYREQAHRRFDQVAGNVVHHVDYEPKPQPHAMDLAQIKLYREFLDKDIFEPILKDDYIDRCALLNNGEHYVGGQKTGHYNGPMKESYPEDIVYTKEKLLGWLTLKPEEFDLIQKSHDYIMKLLPQAWPQELEEMFASKENKNGYVYVAGGKFNYLTLLALKSLRDSGAVYPAEVLIPEQKDYDTTLCNTVFPLLNARCLVMEDFLPKDTKGRVHQYQYKSVALLLNSFQNVLLLDADNMVIKNPDYLFNNEPFTSHGLVTWPDMWRRSTSPLFYDIAKVQVDETNKIRNSYAHVVGDGKAEQHGYMNDEWSKTFHDFEGTIPEASSESGQLLVNKKTHLHTIFLSLYYNFHGPSYFYPILSQNSHGEGDKETYIAAAHVLNQPYYQVQEFARDFHRDHAQVARGVQRTIQAIGQYDPVVEYRLSDYDKQDAWTAYEYSSPGSHWEYKIWKESDLMFLHCNGPKLFAWELAFRQGPKSFKDKKGNRQRLYDGLVDQLEGRDYELKMIGMMKWWFCDNFMNIKGIPNMDAGRICDALTEQETWLRENVY